MRNVVFAISGPSGVGKGTLVKLLLKEDDSLVSSVSCTTRAPRKGEKNGKEYFFLSREEFISRIQENDFLEYDEHFGNYYGTPRSFVERQLKNKSVILEIDVVGALNAKRLMPQTVLIMIVPPDLKALQQRLAGRGSESEAQREERMRRVRYELEQQSKYDYVVVNDDLQSSKRRLQEIIKSEQNKEC
ncbi:MAG: guanylate kinase [Clostridia bacterium]|jgi:guanylate kinase|nr:guanylate kinase [Clostridia bacterium]